MKKFFISLIAFVALPTAINAEKLCKMTSEIDKNVVIDIEGNSLGMIGLLNYKDKPMYRISFRHMNGYGGHRYTVSEYRKNIDKNISWKEYQHPEDGGDGLVIFFVGNQLANNTPIKDYKKDQKRLLMPQLGSDIWYQRRDFEDRKKPDNLKLISAAEGFFKIEGKKCSFPYMF